MLFIHTWEKVLSGEKTQTRRIAKPGETLKAGTLFNSRGIKWDMGRVYSVQPGRGLKSVGNIQVVRISYDEDVRLISEENARAEGFADKKEFLLVWSAMHDKAFFKSYSGFYLGTAGLAEEQWYERKYQEIFLRPAHFYDAWVLEFKLVKDSE